MCFLKHDWDKWEQYVVQVKKIAWGESEDLVGWSEQVRQKRTCKDCGKMQDRRVR